MSCATSSGRVAATPKTDAPRRAPVGWSAFRVSARKAAIEPRGLALQAREPHAVQRAVGTAHVVVEDVVHAEPGSRDGDVDVVLPDRRVGEVREATVAAGVWLPAGCLDDLVLPARPPGRLGLNGVAEGDETPDHSCTSGVQQLDRVLQVEDLPDRADLAAERHRGVPADDSRFVFEVELDRVDALLVEQLKHGRAELRVRPAVGRHVDRPHRVARQPRHEEDGDHTGGGVAGGVPRDDLDRLGRRGREVELEAPVLPDGDHALARDDVRCSSGEPVQHEGRAHLPPEDVAGELQRRRGAVDRDEPGWCRRRPMAGRLRREPRSGARRRQGTPV